MGTWGSRSGKERSFSCSTVTWMVMVSLGCVMEDVCVVYEWEWRFEVRRDNGNVNEMGEYDKMELKRRVNR